MSAPSFIISPIEQNYPQLFFESEIKKPDVQGEYDSRVFGLVSISKAKTNPRIPLNEISYDGFGAVSANHVAIRVDQYHKLNSVAQPEVALEAQGIAQDETTIAEIFTIVTKMQKEREEERKEREEERKKERKEREEESKEFEEERNVFNKKLEDLRIEFDTKLKEELDNRQTKMKTAVQALMNKLSAELADL